MGSKRSGPRDPVVLTKERLERALRVYKNAGDLGRALGCSGQAITRALKRHGLSFTKQVRS